MNKVFEGYVRQQLRKRLHLIGVRVAEKSEENRNLHEGRRLEPDLVLIGDIGRAPVAIADCKYKRDWDFVREDTYQRAWGRNGWVIHVKGYGGAANKDDLAIQILKAVGYDF